MCKDFKASSLACQASFWPRTKDVRWKEVKTHSKYIQGLNLHFRFAEVEVHVLVITLLRRFHLSYHHSPVSIATSFVNKPDRPLKLRFLARCKEDNQS